MVAFRLHVPLPAPAQSVATALTTFILALGGWCILGQLTVRSLVDPSRVGIRPSGWALAILLLVLVGLGVASARVPDAQRRVRVHPLGVALLMLPVILPWTSVPLPPVTLLWTGPLAMAWWSACVVCTHADVCAAWLRRLSAVARSPTRAPHLAAAITGVLLVATAWHTAPQHPKGDEPDYLVITQSLILDGDLQIENNHARADYAAYHPGVLPPSYLQRGTNGQIYSVHAPGVSVLLVPLFAVAGYPGAVATLILIAMAGAWLAWRVCWQATHDAMASWFGTAATVGSATFFLHAGAVFPDAPGAVLALVAAALLVPAVGATTVTPLRAATAGAALAALPWLHTRFAIIAGGFGLLVAWRLWNERRALAAFAAPAAGSAIAWFGSFWLIYGTLNPSAPYGSYTQMAVAHLAPGLIGLLADQQFGLLFAAPALALAVHGLRDPRHRTFAIGILAVAITYMCAVGAYRMWWGGLSAPARFLTPLVLPLAPLVAMGWRALQTRASRWLALVLLLVTLATTAAMVLIDHGALAYNTRDGRAHLLVWLGPVVDLVSAFPAAHRDAPLIVVRDVAIWLGWGAVLWLAWRWAERRGRLTSVVALATLGVCVTGGVVSAWTSRGVKGLAPLGSQVAFLEHGGDPTRVQLDAPPPRGTAPFTVLRFASLPAGHYVLHTERGGPGVRLGVTLGEARVERFLAEADGPGTTGFTLPLAARDVVVKASREAMTASGRVWLEATRIDGPETAPPVVRTAVVGERTWLVPDEGIYAERAGLWLGGDADVTIGVDGEGPLALKTRAGAEPVELEWWGARAGRVALGAGEEQTMTIEPDGGRIRLRSRGGFRPAQGQAGGDQRWLSVWLEPSQ